MRRLVVFFVMLSIVFCPLVQPTVVAQTERGIPLSPKTPSSPNDTPVTLVNSGVGNYTLVGPKLFWHTGVPGCPPTSMSSAQEIYPETIKRIASYGSDVRTVYLKQVNCGAGEIKSNIVADTSYIYWLTTVGMYRISTDANAGDPAELVNSLVASPGELAMASDRIYFLRSLGSSNARVGYVLKSNNAKVDLAYVGTNPHDLKTDDNYVFYRVGTSLYRRNPVGNLEFPIATSVSGYFPEKKYNRCTTNGCTLISQVFVAKGRSIHVFNNSNNTFGSAIYTSSDTTASIVDLTVKSGDTHLFFIERREYTCGGDLCPFPYNYLINRTTTGGNSPATLFTDADESSHPTTDGTYLFFSPTGGSLKRLPNNAVALPSINVYTTGMEVTQTVQNLNNDVLLIKDKRTFVRVYVKAAAGKSVSGVTAILEATSISGSIPLDPVNPAGTSITVRSNPDRDDINESFLFELPYIWTKKDSLTLKATINPYKVPLEPDYSDNTITRTVVFLVSPTFSVEYFRLNYTWGLNTYKPRIFEDVQQNWSWILRAYPLGGAVGENFKPRIWDVDGGFELGSYVTRSNPACYDVYGEPDDDISLCASYYANGWLYYYREATTDGDMDIGLNPNAFFYGMILKQSDFFVRGQAMYDKTSVGPAGPPADGSWDTDASMADWYGAHEMGHSLGRSHPNAGSDDPDTDYTEENCGHSRSDPSYPYGNTHTSRAPIGPSNNTMEGFDVGDAAYGLDMAVLPSSIWNDVMSYCPNEWLSDYTYMGMYGYMFLMPSLTAAEPSAARLSGNFLVVSGAINTNNNKASFSIVRKATSVPSQTPVSMGAYVLRQLDAANHKLTDELFATSSEDQPGILNFSHVLTMQNGVRKLQVVKVADNSVLATYLISAHAPVVSNVVLVGAPNPVTGTVNLSWTASDADGDTLTYDISYTRDGGTTWQPVAAGLSDKTRAIDTASLGGSGTAKLRVTASDGANIGSADSTSFVMANKPPQPLISNPADNLHVHYGQLVNFEGMALDAQDGLVANAGLVWRIGRSTVLGTGAHLSIDDLPVGTNLITLKATDSKGLSASVSVTVIVDDNLDLPGPTLSVGPTTVGWGVPEGTIAQQTATVSITNTGSGNLHWTASTDMAWLHLNVASGDVVEDGDPSPLVLSTNPTGLTSGTQLSAKVTITTGNQSVIIPVTLSVGNVHFTSIFTPPLKKIYLPALRK
jgi:hypothetical protein